MEYPDPGISERKAAVLGLLCESPLDGYMREKIIDERGKRHWTDIGFSSIYHVLKKPACRGLITGSCGQQENKPSRREYTFTKAGNNPVKERVRSLLTRPRCVVSLSEPGSGYNVLLPQNEIVACPQERISAPDRSIRVPRMRKKQQRENQRPYFVPALYDRVPAHLTAEKRGVGRFIREAERHAAV